MSLNSIENDNVQLCNGYIETTWRLIHHIILIDIRLNIQKKSYVDVSVENEWDEKWEKRGPAKMFKTVELKNEKQM
jgi:hypothetical protein